MVFLCFQLLSNAGAKSERTKLYLRHSANQVDDESLRKIDTNLIQPTEHQHVYAYFNAHRWLITF